MPSEPSWGSAGEYWAKSLLLACCYQEVGARRAYRYGTTCRGRRSGPMQPTGTSLTWYWGFRKPTDRTALLTFDGIAALLLGSLNWHLAFPMNKVLDGSRDSPARRLCYGPHWPSTSCSQKGITMKPASLSMTRLGHRERHNHEDRVSLD